MDCQKENLGKNSIYYTNKENKIPRNKLSKKVKDLYLENYRTLKKKLRKTQINRSIYRVHGLAELTSLKCPYYLK